MDEQVRAVLREAKGIVAAGWYQGGGVSADGKRHCMAGANGRAIVHLGLPVAAAYRANDLLACEVGVCAISRWNDATDRTQAEVVALYDRVLTGDPVPVEPDPEDSRTLVAA